MNGSYLLNYPVHLKTKGVCHTVVLLSFNARVEEFSNIQLIN